MGLTFEGYQEMRAMKLARDANAPDSGAMAPDFAVERGGTGPFPRRRYVGDWVCGLYNAKGGVFSSMMGRRVTDRTHEVVGGHG